MNGNKCIYCTNINPVSIEYAFPKSLGSFKFFPPLIDKVCPTCLSKLCWFDERFQKTGSISYFRNYLEIESGRKIVKKTRSKNYENIEFTAYRPEGDFEVIWIFNRTEKTIKIIPQLIIIDKNGETHQIAIKEKWSDENEILIAIKNRGLDLKNNIAVHYIGSQDLFDRYVNGKIKIGHSTHQSSRLFDQNITNHFAANFYSRNIAKIGFHYLLTVQSLLRGDERHVQTYPQFYN